MDTPGPSPAAQPPGRILALDLLRALAVVVFLGAHPPVMPPPGSAGHDLCVWWNRAAFMAVEIFFALSGFLLTNLLLLERQRHGRIDAKAYLIRRAFKIYPPLLCFLIAFGVWLCCKHPGTFDARLRAVWSELWPALMHLQNYVLVPSAGHLWSLATEEHFYVLLLVLIIVSTWRQPRSRTLPMLLIIVLLAAWAARGFKVYRGEDPTGVLGAIGATLYRIDSLVGGALMGCWYRARAGRVRLSPPAWAGVALVAVLGFVPTCSVPIMNYPTFFWLIALPLQGAAATAWLLLSLGVAARLEPERFLSPVHWPIEVLAFLGRSSYSTYLWHLPFVAWAMARLHLPERVLKWQAPYLSYFLLSCVFTLGLGAAGYLAIEVPALWLRKRWFPDRRRLAAEQESLSLQQAA